MIIGIIAEYNPFHYGHAYQIQAVKEKYPHATLVILMSGNVVQRGEFAIIDKWTRAQVAVRAGADLVLELPLLASLQSADYFADWGVNLLNSLRVDKMVFGTESASLEELQVYLNWLKEKQDEVDSLLRDFLNQGYAYPQAHDLAVRTLATDLEFGFNPTSPNHLLGIQYLISLQELGSDIEVEVIQRQVYNEAKQKPILSASQIREKMLAKENYEDFIPHNLYDSQACQQTASWLDYYPYLNYQLSQSNPRKLAKIQSMDDGFENYLLNQYKQELIFDELLEALTTKRYTRAAVKRKLMMVMLQISRLEWEESLSRNSDQAHLRVLAFSTKGQEVLSQHRHNSKVNLFSNLTQSIQEFYQLNLRADRLYQLNLNCQIPNQIFGRYPAYIP